MSQDIEPKYISGYANASKYTGLGERTLRRAVANGQIKAYKIPGIRAIMFKPADLDKALKPVTPLAAHVEMERELKGAAA